MTLITAATAALKPYRLQLHQLVSYDGACLPVHMIGEGKPVLLLHAFGMDARQFLPFVLPLATQFRFYLPHFRGFGLAASTPSTEFDFIEQYASDVSVLLDYICDKHHTEAVDVAGISMGALVMWAHFARYAPQPSAQNQTGPYENNPLPSHQAKNNQEKSNQTKNNQAKNSLAKCSLAKSHRVRRYLNIDQSPIVHNQPDWQGGVFGDKQPDVFARFQHVLQQVLPYIEQPIEQSNLPQQKMDFNHLPFDIKRQVIQLETDFSLMSVAKPASRLFIQSSSYLPDHKLALYQHPTWRQKLHGLRAYLQLPYDYRTALPETKVPVTLLIGAQSQLYDPVWQRKLAKLLPNATVVEITDSGHAIPLDAPIRFTQALKAFLIEK